MEVVGFAASVIALIQVTGKVSQVVYGYTGKVKRASNDINELMCELTSLSEVLIALQGCANGCAPQSTVLQKLCGPLRECTLELQTLELKLEYEMRKTRFRKLLGYLKWPLKDTETLQFMAHIGRHKSTFMLALGADNFTLAKSIEGRVEAVDHSIKYLKEQVQVVSGTQSSQKLEEKITRAKQKRTEFLNWLYPEEFDTKHTDISNRRQKDTGKWLLESTKFQDLVNGMHASRLLWGYGIPGAGKTFLSSGVIDHFEDQTQTSGCGVAYFYFDYKEKDKQTPVQVLASLVKQLVCQIPELPPQIETLYDRLEGQGKRPKLEELFIALISLFKVFSRVFIIFDALDECDRKNQRKELLPLFHRMGEGGASLFITSRYYPEDIQESFRDVPKIELSATGKDIRSYILQKLEESPRAKRLVQQGGCEEKIITELIECAKGMFLLVRFHIEHLCQQTTANQMLSALETLKNSTTEEHPLDPTYDRVLESIRQQPKACTELAISILSWLVKAQRALTVQEIQIAVSIDPKRYRLDERDLPDKATLLEVCASLVTIDESDTVRLAHLTVQEYLLRSSVIPQEADHKIAAACMTYFSFEIFAEFCETEESLDTRLKSYTLLDYAARHMIYHLERCDETVSMDLILEFLAHQSKIGAWVLASMRLKVKDIPPSYFTSLAEDRIPLQIASYIGNQLVVQRLLHEGTDVLALDGHGRTAVQWAALSGQEAILKLLVERGANTSHKDNSGWTALYCAAHGGYEMVVRLLISEMGADTSIRSNDGDTSLSIAAYSGHEAVVKLLLENGADTSPMDKDGYTPLHRAAQFGREAVVKLLLENGADTSPMDNYGYTPLHRAAQFGHEAVAKLLLENGVDTSPMDKDGYTPLHRAAQFGHEAVAKLLLENGADTSPMDKDGYTPLHWAAQFEHEAVAKLLLGSGADTSPMDKDGYTPLHWTAQFGHEAVAKLLLENGADTSPMDSYGYTPLHRAAQFGHEAVAKLLIENGANTSATDQDGDTPLHWAAQFGCEEVAKLLLEDDVDTSITNNDGETPLRVAEIESHEAVAKLIREHGVDA